MNKLPTAILTRHDVAAPHIAEPCNPLEHIIIEFVIGVLTALLVTVYFRGTKPWREELPEYLVGALFSAMVVGTTLCYIAAK
jgi:hypothetical protein